ncbi:MAG: flippase-like domain-containing protein [Clostridia bacterium]|nr:flippase-like domain-containing protein [Clostridia bacterium]
MERTKKVKKMLRNFIIFLLLIILTFSIILKDQDVTEIFEILGSVRKEFILIAILCMCFFIVCEAINIGRTLKALNEKSTFWKNIKYALIGFFFSSITPAASGGQPMQIYYMHRDNISVANSTLALLINLTCVQIVTISGALFSLFFNYAYLDSALIWFFVIGVSLNLSALLLLLISIFSKRMTKGIINITIKILTFFRVKDVEKKKVRFESELTKYQDSAKYVKSHMHLILKNLITTYIQYIAYYSISYWVYCSFGLSNYNAFEIITMQSVLYATVSGIPSPGAVGVSEGGFIAIFKRVFPETMINGAMILNRGVNFYLFVILSSIVVMINAIREKKQGSNDSIEEKNVEKN